MKKTFLLLTICLFCSKTPLSVASENEAINETIVNESHDFTPNEVESILNSNFYLDIINKKTPTIKRDTKLDDCIEQVEGRQSQLIKKSLIVALIAIPSVPVATVGGWYLGSKVGRILTPHSLWAQISASSIGSTVGFWGGLAFFLTKEGIKVNEFFSNHKLLTLLKAVSENNTQDLIPTQHRLMKHKAEFSENTLSQSIHELVNQNKVCITDSKFTHYRKLIRILAKKNLTGESR